MINTSEISTAKTTDPYDTYWWLAPRYFEELASRPKYLVAIESGTMLFITLIAFTGNSLICLAILRNPRLRTATNYLIFTLSATDLITACTTLTVATIVLLNGEWIVRINPLDVSSFPCRVQGILSPALTGFSVHVMALTALNRYICVAQQRLYNKMFSKQGTCVIVLVDAVILVGLTTFPCPAGLAKVTLDPRRALCFTTFQQQATAQMIGNLFLGLNVLLPLFIICLCYFRVFIAIRKNSFRVEEARLASARIKEVRITKTVFAVLVGFLFCWIPAMVCNYLSFNMINPRFPRQGELVFTFFLSVSSAINPFIYGTTCRSLRKEFLHPFRCRKTKRVKQKRTSRMR
ncbi:melatonin receptor type 1B-A-like [Acropora millepora]|uniref:melatonin receptor type 1B-A-like n=1 Tax=Acropora millepora TaxID=45264 RepID=UPI001CF1539B|nr:melatonin receptor type 1B-A-like [Acropora millepora]